MSKSVGNVINPAEIISKEGSDVLRLWAAGSNFTSDVTIGPEIIKQVVENKRKIRNTLRFILGNLIGYDPDAKKTISRLDQLILHKFETVMSDCNEAYKQYDFATGNTISLVYLYLFIIFSPRYSYQIYFTRPFSLLFRNFKGSSIH